MGKLEEALKLFPSEKHEEIKKYIKEQDGRIVVDWVKLGEEKPAAPEEHTVLEKLGILSREINGHYSLYIKGDLVEVLNSSGKQLYFVKSDDLKEYGQSRCGFLNLPLKIVKSLDEVELIPPTSN